MPKISTSVKHLQIDKANSVVIVAVAGAVVLAIFAGFTSNALLSMRSYQREVIVEKESARDQLEANLEAALALQSSYNAFVSTPENVIGGIPDNDGPNDGDNGRIVLDSLPSSYDFPALMTSIESLLVGNNVEISQIGGTDEELSQSDEENLPTSEPVQMPFAINVSASYDGIQTLVNTFERSIRPFNFNTVTLAGDDDDLRFELGAHTYFQPEKRFEVTTRTVQPE